MLDRRTFLRRTALGIGAGSLARIAAGAAPGDFIMTVRGPVLGEDAAQIHLSRFGRAIGADILDRRGVGGRVALLLARVIVVIPRQGEVTQEALHPDGFPALAAC